MSGTASLLVVDDEPEICEILVEYFSNQGFDIKSARDSARARELFSDNAPDLAILDIRMPGEDGLSLARWIREEHRDVCIIMLTTAADVVDRIVGLEIGADDYLTKPFGVRELTARVKALLRRALALLTGRNALPRPALALSTVRKARSSPRLCAFTGPEPEPSPQAGYSPAVCVEIRGGTTDPGGGGLAWWART